MEAQSKKMTFSEDELGQIKEVSDEFFDLSGSIEGSFVNKTLFFQVYLALLISIPCIGIFDILAKYEKNAENESKKEENEDENEENDSKNSASLAEEIEKNKEDPATELENRYQDLLNSKQVNFKSKSLEKRIKAKFEYYETCIKIRAEIQNYDYDYHGLGQTAANFMMTREQVKVQAEQLNKYGIGSIQCYGCNTKWLKDPKAECLTCRSEEAIKLYVVMANYFRVIGDMDTFWEVLDPATKEKLYDPKKCQAYHDYFKKLQNRRAVNLNHKLHREYGLKQYKELVKTKGAEEVDADEELKEFNREYGLALVREEEVIDLKEAKNTFKKEFVEDLSLIEFNICKKVWFPYKKVDLNAFKPAMPQLQEIVAIGCQIRQLELDPKYFPCLWRLNLEENKIEMLTDIFNLRNLPKLKKIELARNPIEKTNEIYKAKNSFKKVFIEVIFSSQLMYRCKRDLEDESDQEIKEDMLKFKDLYEEESSKSNPSLSDLDSLLENKK